MFHFERSSRLENLYISTVHLPLTRLIKHLYAESSFIQDPRLKCSTWRPVFEYCTVQSAHSSTLWAVAQYSPKDQIPGHRVQETCSGQDEVSNIFPLCSDMWGLSAVGRGSLCGRCWGPPVWRNRRRNVLVPWRRQSPPTNLVLKKMLKRWRISETLCDSNVFL